MPVGVAVVRAHRQLAVHRLPRAPIFTPGYFVSFSNGSGGQSGLALVEPQAEALRIGPVGFVEAGLVDQAEILPAIVAAVTFSRSDATR